MMIGALILFSAVALLWLAMWLSPAQRHLLRFVYSVGDPPEKLNGGFPCDDVVTAYPGDPEEWPAVTVIVPGRNEGHILEKTLGSLCVMRYPRFRVVFVDDQSTDNTAAVCRALEKRFSHLTVIHNNEGPRDGWVGKTWAVHQAAEHMREGDYLLFTDSDLEFHPECLTYMVRLARHRRADIASLLPRIEYKTMGELLGLLAAMVIINMRLSLYVCNNPKVPRALVAGGFLLVRREVYEALGGHAAVRGQVVEDVAFGTRAKAKGYRVFTALTHDLYRARMYEGWGDTYRGLKKNAYAGANYNLALGVVIAGFLFFAGVMPVAFAVGGMAYAAVWPSGIAYVLAVTGVLAWVFQMRVAVGTARFAGFPVRVVWALPASFAFYLCVFVGSVVDYYGGGNVWAGRKMVKAEALSEAGKRM